MSKKIEIKYQKKKQKVSLLIRIKRFKVKRAMNKIPILTHYVMIEQLLREGALDEHIKIMDRKKIDTHNSSVLKKDYLSSEEHFVYLLDIFITHFLETISNIELAKSVLALCIKNDKNKILLSKNYYFSNDYLKEYLNNFNLMIITNFYENSLAFEKELKNEYKIIGYSPKKLDINKMDDTEEIISLLSEIVITNKSRYTILSLFSKVTDETYNAYLSKWERMLLDYINNIDFVKAYRKFKYNKRR